MNSKTTEDLTYCVRCNFPCARPYERNGASLCYPCEKAFDAGELTDDDPDAPSTCLECARPLDRLGDVCRCSLCSESINQDAENSHDRDRIQVLSALNAETRATLSLAKGILSSLEAVRLQQVSKELVEALSTNVDLRREINRLEEENLDIQERLDDTSEDVRAAGVFDVEGADGASL